MKYLLLILLIGCTQHPEIKEIDGCEYILVKDQYGKIDAITHKGNCANEIHQYIDTTDMYEPHLKPYLYGRFNHKDVRVAR